jgi:hypothetical protein
MPRSSRFATGFAPNLSQNRCEVMLRILPGTTVRNAFDSGLYFTEWTTHGGTRPADPTAP